MGLDVYLCKYNTTDDIRRLVSGANSDSEDDAAYPEPEYISIPSALHPDHYFKIGYFRSSYNASGINGVLHDRINTDLYGIFNVSGRDYYVAPNWQQAKENAERAKEALVLYRETKGDYSVVTADSFDSFDNEQAVLSAFMSERAKQKTTPSTFGAYSNHAGLFFAKDPPTVYAAFTGMRFGRPCAYFVVDGELAYYVQALDIVIETCDYMLRQPDPELYLMHWSG